MDGLLAKGVNLGDNITVRRLGQLPRLDRKAGQSGQDKQPLVRKGKSGANVSVALGK